MVRLRQGLSLYAPTEHEEEGGAHVAADAAPAAPATGTQTPPNPNSKRSLKKALAKATGKTPKAKAPKIKKDDSCSVAVGSGMVANGTLIKGGVLGMLAAGASGMCERDRSRFHPEPTECHTWMC